MRLGAEPVPVRQPEAAARLGEPGGDERGLEAGGSLRHVPCSGPRARAVSHERRGLRRWQLGVVDAAAPPECMLGNAMLHERVLRGGRRTVSS
jgi:hypothetical protein